jgi:hypothetical protein
MTMSCVDGADYQCSGEAVLRVDNGVALSRSGVQVHGRSTSDLLRPNPNVSEASGMALSGSGVAELRARTTVGGPLSMAVVMLDNLGLSWNATTPRPRIVETFRPDAGRVWLDAAGALSFGTLPPSSDLGYYDIATRGTGATQANYANNRYFPRSAPPRCPAGYTPCPTAETAGLVQSVGDWTVGGTDPDVAYANRFHEDGDVHAGNGLPGAGGSPQPLPGGTGFGVPYPGSKGIRSLVNWRYRHGNLAWWSTQDTVQIYEWGALDEHNKTRRGVVAFGAVTDPAGVPTAGTARYVGMAYGSYSSTGANGPNVFRGTATVVVDFASRTVTVTIQNTVVDGTATTVPLALNANVMLAVAGSGEANYLTGFAANAALSGGLSGRFFGPVVAGGSGAGPAEIGGAFSLSNATTKAAAVGGFIARKQ